MTLLAMVRIDDGHCGMLHSIVLVCCHSDSHPTSPLLHTHMLIILTATPPSCPCIHACSCAKLSESRVFIFKGIFKLIHKLILNIKITKEKNIESAYQQALSLWKGCSIQIAAVRCTESRSLLFTVS